MHRIMLKSKIHRATVTDADLHYEGSIAIDEVLLETAGIIPFEKVQVYNITNGERFETYTINAERGSGTISVNGAAAHLASKGDMIIIASYSAYAEEEARAHAPVLVYVDGENGIKDVKAELVHSI